MSKIIDRLKGSPKVEDAWSDGDGYWVCLAPGWQDADFDQHCHTIHERTVRDAMRRFSRVVKCDCNDCLEAHHYQNQ